MSKNQCIKVSTLEELFMTSAKLHLAVYEHLEHFLPLHKMISQTAINP